MKKLLFILFLVPILSFSQGCQYGGKKGDIAQICDFYRGNNFSTNLNAEKALDRILNVTGMAKRFVLYQCSDIDNCVATAYRGVRYILYDKEFMEDIANNSSSWTNISILAHEIGHHVNGHSLDLLAVSTGHIDAPSLKESREMELEADEYSGFVMQKLGATLYQAQAALKVFATDGDDTYSTHPNKAKRLAAVERGFNKAEGNNSTSNIPDYSIVNSSMSSDDYFQEAYNAQNNGNHNEAIEKYTKCIQLGDYANQEYALDNRAFSYFDLGKYYDAIADVKRALEINPNYPNALSRMGVCLQKLGNHNEAISWINKALEACRNQSCNLTLESTYDNRAFSYYELGKYYDAIADVKRALEINPNYPNALSRMGLCLQKLGNHNEAISWINKALEACRNQSCNLTLEITYDNRAFSYCELGKYYDAIADVKRALEINPNFFKSIQRLAWIFNQLEDYKSAIPYYDKAILLNKNDGYSYTGRGFSKQKLGLHGYCTDYKKGCDLGNSIGCSNYSKVCK